MKEKNNPESKLNITLKNTNKKRDVILDDSDEIKEGGPSLLKKNEYAFIFLGAALLSIVIVFIFFRPSGKQETASAPSSKDTVQVFETRIAHIENILAEKLGSGAEGTEGTDGQTAAGENTASIESYKQRVERVETAFSVKFDSLAERLDRLEKQIALLSQKAAAPVAVPEKQPVKSSSSPTAKTATAPKPKPAAKAPEPMLHTVVKGETLYSISRKYNTTVAQLRKLNKLSEKDDIYPGNNILVR